MHTRGFIRYEIHWAFEVYIPLWTKKKESQGSEMSKEIVNLQVAKE